MLYLGYDCFFIILRVCVSLASYATLGMSFDLISDTYHNLDIGY